VAVGQDNVVDISARQIIQNGVRASESHEIRQIAPIRARRGFC
jgi:hypothetical protein